MADPEDYVGEQKLVNAGLDPNGGDPDLITGETNPDGTANINEAGYTDVDGVEEGGPDDTPQVHTLTSTKLPNGTTMITARYHDPVNGWSNKSKALPGVLTAQQLANAILNVGNW